MTDVFSNKGDTTTQNPLAMDNALEALVGEGKKFKTVDDLAKGKVESDAYIQRLQDEQAELRKELEKRLSAEEVAKQILQRERSHPSEKPDGDNQAKGTSREELASVLEEELNKREAAVSARNNILEANRVLVERMGGPEGAVKLLETKAAELGVQVGWLKDMAARSPKALYNLLGFDNQPVAPSTGTKSDINTNHPNVSGQSKKGTKATYDALRKENPGKYWSAEVQNEIFKAMKQGSY